MGQRKYYIRKNELLAEVTYEEYQGYILDKRQEGTVYFVCIQNTLMEVTQDIYIKHYRAIRRRKYLTKEAPYEELHYQSLDTDDILGEEMLHDDLEMSAEDKAVYNIYLDKLYPALKKLTDEERNLLYGLFYLESSERALAKQFGISQAAIHKRKNKILNQLRGFMQL